MSASHTNHQDTPEPQTPMWLPAVGALLFAAAGVWWATLPNPAPPIVADTSADAAAPSASAAPPAAAPPTTARALPQMRPGQGAPPGMPGMQLAGGGHGAQPDPGGRHALPDPSKAAEIQRLMNQARNK
jgi:hypothetical protein